MEMNHKIDATFSIVAMDRESGETGVAISTKRPAVGNRCIAAVAGVGAVASQATTNPYIPRQAIELMRSLPNCSQVFDVVAKQDFDIDSRQINLVSNSGDSFSFTGTRCQPYAGGMYDRGFAIAGNILTGREVIDAMQDSFENSAGTLAYRLVLALLAGEQQGGDKRGKQSAAVLVSKIGWHPFVDLRVDDSEDPVSYLLQMLKAREQEILNVHEALPDLGFRVLTRGMVGLDVSDVSVLMKALGFLESSSTEWFTVELERAVSSFQKENGLAATGEFARDALECLRTLVARGAQSLYPVIGKQ